jgi:hypothetical protein
MKHTLTLLRQRLLLFSFFAFIATALLSSLASNTTIPLINDIYNHVAAIVQAKIALMSGQFPLRVAPLEHDGWFYPQFQFYSSSSYTFAALVYRWLTPTNPFVAYKITIWCALVLGGIYLYRLAYWIVKSKPAALLASVVYLASPYYMVVINHIGGFNEAVALGILPVVLYYTIQRYYYPTRNKTLVQTSLAWYLLATIHFITFFYASFFVAILLMIITCQRWKYWINLLNVGIAYVFSCCLAMWYLAPAALLAKFFMITSTFDSTPLVVDAHRSLLTQLFSPVVNGLTIGADISSQIHPSLGLPILIAVGMCCYAMLSQQQERDRRANFWLPALLIVFFIAIFMVWSPINFWQWLPRTGMVAQYPWRLLGQVIWMGALLFAWGLCWLFKNKLDVRHVAVGVFIVILSTSDWLPIKGDTVVYVNKIIQHATLIGDSANDYLVNTTKYPGLIDITDKKFLNSSAVLSVNQVKKSCHPQNADTLCELNVPSSVHLLELPVLYYPALLNITLNGRPVTYQSVLNQKNLIAAVVPQPGVNVIQIQFRGLLWANAISTFSFDLWLLFFVFIVARRIHIFIRKWELRYD